MMCNKGVPPARPSLGRIERTSRADRRDGGRPPQSRGETTSHAPAEAESAGLAEVELARSSWFWATLGGRLIDVNHQACESLGYSREELLGLTLGDINPALDAKLRRETFWRALAPHDVVVIRSQHRRKDGSWFPIELHLGRVEIGGGSFLWGLARHLPGREPFADADQNSAILEAIFGYFQNGTAAAAAQQILECALRITGAHSGIVIAKDGTEDAQILAVAAPAAEEEAGFYTLARHEIQRSGKLANPRGKSLLLTPLQEETLVLSNAPADQPDQAAQLPGAFLRLESYLGVPAKVEGETLGMLGLANRRGGFAQRETELAEAIAGGGIALLLSISRQNAAQEQLETQLRETQRVALMGQLVGGITHDFNNLLTAILGHAELATTGLESDDPRRNHLTMVRGAGERAAELIAQLLAFRGKQTRRAEHLNLNDLLANLARMLHRVIGTNTELVLLPGSGLATIYTAASQVEQVVMNLVINARDAMPAGGRITLQTENTLVEEPLAQSSLQITPGAYVKMSVRDSGCGMSSETMTRIFEPRFTTKERGRGHGLGLSNVHRIVEQHGGAVLVSSEPGEGSTFDVFFPALDRPATTTEAAVVAPQPFGTETVLVAEENLLVRGLAKDVLEHAGYTVLTARDGEEAIQIFTACADSIDLVLLNLTMPKLSGSTAAQRLNARQPGIPLVLACDHALESPEFGRHAHILRKPYGASALLNVVRTALDAKDRE